MINATESTSTRPYLIRALYEWCADNGLTPYVAVQVDESVRVPREYVKNGEIVLNVSADATSALTLGNDFIEFKARFAGTAREIMVPVGRVIAIYARENGQGMAFPPPSVGTKQPAASSAAPRAESDGKGMHLVPAEETPTMPDSLSEVPAKSGNPPSPPPSPSRGGKRPSLKRVK